MASMSLYPPILDSSMPAFNYKQKCPIEFSLSKFNSADEVKSIHISVTYQKSGANAVNKTGVSSSGRHTQSGIIIINMDDKKGLGAYRVENNTNLYSININYEDIYGGWKDSEIYKVQMRFSSVAYNPQIQSEQWLYDNANFFSEWSTICAIKPINDITITIPTFNYNSDNQNENVNTKQENTLYSTVLDFYGSYYCKTNNETLYSYELILYDATNTIVERSGILYTNEYNNSNQFKYIFTTELINNSKYQVHFTYTTEHGYTETIKFNFSVYSNAQARPDFSIVTVDNDIYGLFQDMSTLESEEEEGRIGIKIFDPMQRQFSGNICIRRTDSKSNFTKWEDIKIIVYRQELINSKEPFFDYTIESGVWYKYGLQELTVTANGEVQRSDLTPSEPIIRNFNYSYLLGANGVQLKLKFNNDMNSYKINVNEGKLDTIGGVYPFITRNGNPNYRTIPINGLISFNMDEMNTFSSKKNIYGDTTPDNQIMNYYNNYNTRNNIMQYDYTYERFFREKVLKFLYDGKPKLFKSPTEGNILIRLMDINTTPQQNLGRMIYNFTSTGHEVAEATMDNYVKYNFTTIGEPEKSFAIYQYGIGQIIADFAIDENICQKIWEKYDSQGKNYAGYSYTLEDIKYVRIEINSQPVRITNNSQTEDTSLTNKQDYTIGHKLNYNGDTIIIYNDKNVYEFDSMLSFTKNDIISFVSYEGDDKPETINATIDFVYKVSKDIYVAKQVLRYEYTSGCGQYYEATTAGTSIYNLLYSKYYIEWGNRFSRLSRISSIEIEATPGAVFSIRDIGDIKEEHHEIGFTGVLNIENLTDIKELKFLGFRQPDGTILSQKYIKTITNEDGNTEQIYQPISTDILVNYNYVLTKGDYIQKNAT